MENTFLLHEGHRPLQFCPEPNKATSLPIVDTTLPEVCVYDHFTNLIV